jgi:hypothetical protein
MHVRDWKSAQGVLVGKPEGKRLLGRSRSRQEDGLNCSSRSGLGVWIGFIWIRIGTRVGLLYIR